MRRKIAFSNKKKKAQLLEKRARKRADREQELDAERRYYEELEGISRPVAKEENELKNQVKELDHAKNAQSENKNKLTSQFDKLTKDQLEANKKRAMEPLKRGDSLSMKKLLEVPALGEDGGWSNENSDDQRVVFIPEVDIPVRPPWDYGMSREQVEENEQRYFTEWMKKIEALKLDDKVSLFEKNIEVN
ncbi:Guanine nucleotide-binding protein-like 1 [Zancudomyces culisetae]|uniref:Guanine nucleotide-binding protein-like 1 n=1 Tax=Zancudomyces culisetae TaxID=1213189 RepID=A0A1R1PST8_ZANCU|nr:Guanine nucleotide-binding protein-like 1 [Zancudomyces culisetae]|eukprot:OMH83963.1 Guanine nucleotide-binding protein-like 1 [Zancudomyces culisetae]